MTPLRLDDLGASSKQYEWWSRRRWANVYPLHHRKLFGAWGPYPELSPPQLEAIFTALDAHGASMTVAITAYWVERDGTLVPYPEKFPDQAAVVRRWAHRGTVEVALHGRTHCLVGWHRPRWIGGNRRWHREIDPFQYGAPADEWPIVEARRALEAWLALPITTVIPPGLPADGITRVWHDREFVLDRTALARFRQELAVHEYGTVQAWRAQRLGSPRRQQQLAEILDCYAAMGWVAARPHIQTVLDTLSPGAQKRRRPVVPP